MVRPAALPAAYAADRRGNASGAVAQPGSGVVRVEIECYGLLSLVTALAISTGPRRPKSGRRARGE
jgi:hypothetical protein